MITFHILTTVGDKQSGNKNTLSQKCFSEVSEVQNLIVTNMNVFFFLPHSNMSCECIVSKITNRIIKIKFRALTHFHCFVHKNNIVRFHT